MASNKIPRDEEEMRVMYPCYRGDYAHFDINAVQTHISNREARRTYKLSLAILRKEEEKRLEMKRQAKECQEERPSLKFNIEECTRCFMIKRGMIFIADEILCTCAAEIPQGITEYVEKEEIQTQELENDCEYTEIMAMSTALGAIWKTPAIETDQPPVKLIREKNLLSTRKEDPLMDQLHQCEAIIQPELGMAETITITDNMELESNSLSTSHLRKSEDSLNEGGVKFQDHTIDTRTCVIYAPSGFGKTAYQKHMMQRGVVILDTDDIPYMTSDKLKAILITTSVLTNRLDLITPDMPTIAIVPSTSGVLKRSGFDLTDEEFDYWQTCHEKFYQFERIIICKVQKCFLIDILTLTQTREKKNRVSTHSIDEYLLRELTRTKAKLTKYERKSVDFRERSSGQSSDFHSKD